MTNVFQNMGTQKIHFFMGLRLEATMKTRKRMIWEQPRKLNQCSKKKTHLLKQLFWWLSQINDHNLE
jgi:hypothetical protein